jgi:hypothetical protein
MGRSVQRYFFTIRGRDHVKDDPDGVYLPDVASYAEYTIREPPKKERLKRSDSDDGRTGSSPSDGFVLAIFPWLLKGAPRCEVAHPRRGAADRGERGEAAGAVGKPESES